MIPNPYAGQSTIDGICDALFAGAPPTQDVTISALGALRMIRETRGAAAERTERCKLRFATACGAGQRLRAKKPTRPARMTPARSRGVGRRRTRRDSSRVAGINA